MNLRITFVSSSNIYKIYLTTESAKLPALFTYLEMLFTIVFVIDDVDLAGDDVVAHAAAVPDLLHSDEDGGLMEAACTFSLIDESAFLQFHP